MTAGFIENKLGKIVYNLNDINVFQHKTSQYIIMIIGFIFIIVYFKYKYFIGMTLQAMLIVLICNYFISLGIYTVLYKGKPFGIYESGMKSPDGATLYSITDSFYEKNDDNNRYSIIVFKPKSKTGRNKKIVVLFKDKKDIRNYLIKKAGCKYMAENV